MSNAGGTKFRPETERDAFQDLNATFNLGIPVDWYRHDDKVYETLGAISKRFNKQIAEEAADKCYLSQYDMCFVWDGKKKDIDKDIQKVYNIIEAAGLNVVVWSQDIQRYTEVETTKYHFMLVGLQNGEENEHIRDKIKNPDAFSKINYRTKRLLFEAHRTKYTLPLNAHIIEECARGPALHPAMKPYFNEFPWKTFKLQEKNNSNKQGEQTDLESQKEQEKKEQGKDLLTDLDETRLLLSILSDRNEGRYEYKFNGNKYTVPCGGSKGMLQRCMDDKRIAAWFPISYDKESENNLLIGEKLCHDALEELDFSYISHVVESESIRDCYTNLCSKNKHGSCKSRISRSWMWLVKRFPSSLKCCKRNNDMGLKRTTSRAIDKVRLYFGEQIALYFAFLNHLSLHLFLPSIVALLIYWRNTVINDKIPYPDEANMTNPTQRSWSSNVTNHSNTKDFFVSLDPKDYRQVYYDDESLVWYAFFVALWATWVIESWSSRQSTLVFEWHTEAWEKEEEPRIAFVNAYNSTLTKKDSEMRSSITGEIFSKKTDSESYYDLNHEYLDPREILFRTSRRRLIFWSCVYISLSSIAALVLAFSVLYLRALLTFGPLVLKPLSHSIFRTPYWKHFIPMIIAALNNIQIYICGQLYEWLATFLTHQENHRTETEFEDSLMLKTFAFQFINNFGSYLYMAFIQEFESFAVLFGGPNGCSKGCVHYLGIQLFYMFLFKLIFGNIMELGFDYVRDLICLKFCKRRQLPKPIDEPSWLCCCTRCLKRCACCGKYTRMKDDKSKATATHATTNPEDRGNSKAVVKRSLFCCCTSFLKQLTCCEKYKEFNDDNFETPTIHKDQDKSIANPGNVALDFCEQKMYTVEERTKDYMELAIMFGYTSLFVVASPLIVPLAFVSVIFESQVDAEKLKLNYLRPMPQKAQDMGMLVDIFKFIAWFSAFSNMYIGAFVMRTTYMDYVVKTYGLVGQFVLFILCEHTTVILKLILEKIARIPDQEIVVQQERQRFIVNAMFDNPANVKMKHIDGGDTDGGDTDGGDTDGGDDNDEGQRKIEMTETPTGKARRYSKEPVYT